MKVSIITVTYNSCKYLEECILSVIKQNYKNIEHIIVDGNSTDGTLDIINRYSEHITTWVSEKDRGMYDAINKGIRMATGNIIGLLNSDDMLASNDTISEIVECFQKHKVDSIFGDLIYIDPVDTQKVLRVWKGIPYKRNRFAYGWMPAHPTFYVRKEIVDKLGGYESHYFTAADFEFMVRYLYRHRISSYYLSKLIVKMRKGGASNGNIYRRLRANRRDYLAMKKNNIPFPLIVSVLKPVRKLPQYYNTFIHKIFTKKQPNAKPWISLPSYLSTD